MFDVLKGEGRCVFGGAFRPLRFPKCFNKVALLLSRVEQGEARRCCHKCHP